MVIPLPGKFQSTHPVDPPLARREPEERNGKCSFQRAFGRRHWRASSWEPRSSAPSPRARPRGRTRWQAQQPQPPPLTAASSRQARAIRRSCATSTPTSRACPSSSFVRGGMYEPLVITTPAGGGREYKWLAQSYTWSKDARTLTLNIRQERPLVGRQAAHRGRRRLQPDRRASRARRWTSSACSARTRTSPPCRQQGSHGVVIRLKTQGLAVRLGQPERDLRRARSTSSRRWPTSTS